MVANIQQIHTNSDGTLCITPMQVHKSGPFNQNTNITIHHHTTPPNAGQTLLNNNTNANNANLLQLCRALNNTNSQFNNNNNNHNQTNCGPNNINFNDNDIENRVIQIKTEKEIKYKPNNSPGAGLSTSVKNPM